MVGCWRTRAKTGIVRTEKGSIRLVMLMINYASAERLGWRWRRSWICDMERNRALISSSICCSICSMFAISLVDNSKYCSSNQWWNSSCVSQIGTKSRFGNRISGENVGDSGGVPYCEAVGEYLSGDTSIVPFLRWNISALQLRTYPVSTLLHTSHCTDDNSLIHTYSQLHLNLYLQLILRDTPRHFVSTITVLLTSLFDCHCCCIYLFVPSLISYITQDSS